MTARGDYPGSRARWGPRRPLGHADGRTWQDMPARYPSYPLPLWPSYPLWPSCPLHPLHPACPLHPPLHPLYPSCPLYPS